MADPKHPRHFSDDFKRQIVELYNAGKRMSEIMAEYDLERSTVRRLITSINAKGTFALARVDFSFERKRAFAVWYTDGTAGLYRRAEVPSTGDAFDGRTVARVETGIEDKAGLFKDDSGLTSVTAVDEGIRPKTTSDWFHDCANLEEADLDRLDTSKVTSMGSMLDGCCSLTTLDVSGWDTSSVTDMSDMFEGCCSLTTLDVSGWDTPKVTNMGDMFRGCYGLTTLDVSGLDTSSVTDMRAMFSLCIWLTTLDVSGWDTSKVTDMSYMFFNCPSLTTLDVSGFDTSSVTNMYFMFSWCPSLTTLDVSGWDTSKVTDMGYMFSDCSSLRSLALGTHWTNSLVGTELPGTLYGADGTAHALADVPLGVAATYCTRAEYVP